MFYTQPLLHPSEDRLPVSTTLPIRLSSRACWAPDEAARLMVIHRDDGGVHLVITTFELKATKSRLRRKFLMIVILLSEDHYSMVLRMFWFVK